MLVVYVDDVAHDFGRMKMCHMWADSRIELFAMAERIGVQLKWFQTPPKASWDHFDISLSKKALALANGAVLTDKFGPVWHVAMLDMVYAQEAGDNELFRRAVKKLAQVHEIRHRWDEITTW